MAVPITSESIAETIAKHLERLILQGALRPGEKLASERDLAEILKISRPSLRDALELLSERGLLTTTRSGTFVAQFLKPIIRPLASLLENNPQAVGDYFEYRQTIDEQAARYAAMRANEPDREAIAGCIERMKAAHELESPDKEAQADVDLHLLIYDASHNIVLAHVMRALAEMLRSNIFYSRDQLYARPNVRPQLLAQHVEMAAAILGRDPDRAAKAAAAHVAFTWETVKAIQADKARLQSSLMRVDREQYLQPKRPRREKSRYQISRKQR